MQERVPFRLIRMPCCGFMFCNVNNRMPNYCIECGKFVFHTVREGILMHDQDTKLVYDESKMP